MKIINTSSIFLLLVAITTRKYQQSYGFTLTSIPSRLTQPSITITTHFRSAILRQQTSTTTTTISPSSRRSPTSNSIQLYAALLQQQDIEVIQLVVGQENYGLAVVCVGEAVWSFLSAPSVDHIKVLIPAGIAAAVLVLISGPMITSSGDVDSIGTGIWIATATSTALGVSYIARMIAPYSPSPKEIAGLGLLVAIAGFFSFAQNLLVDGFVILPSLPTIDLPDLSNIVGTTTTTVDVPDIVSTLPIEFSTTLPEIPASEALQ